MSSFQFELVSPERLLFSKPVAMVTVPGGEGEYGVLPGHAPMMTVVKAGTIEVFTEENAAASDRIFVTGGFAEVTPTRCTVLVSEALPVEELNRASLQQQAKELEAKLAAAPAAERAALEAQQDILTAKIQAAA